MEYAFTGTVVVEVILWSILWKRDLRQWAGLHHFWFGIVAQVAAAAWYGYTSDLVGPVILWAVGVYLSADDLWQHWRQRRWTPDGVTLYGFPSYRQHLDYHSPVHRLYAYLFGGLHRKVVGWFK